jgi:hypothetical protein
MGQFEQAVNQLVEQGMEDEQDLDQIKSKVWVLRSADEPYRYVSAAGDEEPGRFGVTFKKEHARLYRSRIQAIKSAQKMRAVDSFSPYEMVV